MSQTNWEADKMLDVYIYDYLMKRKLHNSAKAFQAEGKVSTEPVAIDAPGGFLFEWWSVFWDIFIARTNGKHSEAAASYIETQMIKAREQQHHHQQQQQQQHQQQQASSQQQQQKSPQQQQQQHTQMQMQNLQIRQAQQQQQHRRDMGSQILSGPADVLVGNDSLLRQSPSTANSMAAKMYEDELKIPIPMQKDSFGDGAMKQRFGENVGQIIDPSIMKAAALASQASGQMLLGMPEAISGNLQQAQNRHQLQQLPNVPGTPQDIKNILMNSKGVGPDGSLTGIHGLNQGGSSNNLTLKGWPLTALEKLRPGYNIPQGNSMLQSPQSFNQMQQHLWLQSQQNLTSPSANDLESRKMRMMIANSRSMNSVGDMANLGSPVQSSYPVLPRGDPDILLKMQQQQQQQMQNNNQQQLQYSQHQLLNQTPQNSSHQMRQQEKILGASSVAADGSVSANSFQGNEQASKSQGGRKRKQPVSSSGPANSSGTANTTGPSPSSPSTPSTHTPADAISMPTMAHNGASSKSLLMYGSDGLGQITSASNQLADIDRFVDDGSLEDNVESFLSQEDADPRDRVTRCSDVSKGFTFSEVVAITASTNKIECCHFSSDGKFLATGGHDRKAVLWCTESYSVKSTHEEHSQWITDVRFSPTLSRLATSSADKTVRVWDADNPGYSLRTFTGHSTTVMSLDFHPNKEDLICSCDNNSEIRYWSVKNGSCVGVSKGGATQLRFQPCFGRILAATADNYVSLLDVETQVCISKLQGHKSIVNSVTWDFSGEYVASVSNDLVRVWRVGSNNKSEQSYELRSTGNKFHTCIFHPSYPILIIGCYEALEIWNMAENKVMSVHAHDKLVSSLAVSKATGLFASASHDKTVKLWH